MCPCYNRRTHYPTLEKQGAQNITTCGNQDKQRKLSYHCKQDKNTFGKITGDNAKKTKIMTEIHVLTKAFTKSVFKVCVRYFLSIFYFFIK